MTILEGKNRDHLATLPDNSVDSLVTDPPAGISFMGKAWDTDKGGRTAWIADMTATFAECHRVLKPGSYGLVWALPRTSHWTATALEDAGFEVRDVIVHLFGTGFPKSVNLSKAIDAHYGLERPIIRTIKQRGNLKGANRVTVMNSSPLPFENITAPASEDAKKWDGFGTALKPSNEHWILVRKALEGTNAENILAHGTGGLNIDACRIGNDPITTHHTTGGYVNRLGGKVPGYGATGATSEHEGRFPANTILDDDPDLLEAEWAKFFYCAKPSVSEKNAGLTLAPQSCGVGALRDGGRGKVARNTHPTVKALALMRYLITLVTPPGGTVLDPFLGSGTTLLAAQELGFDGIGIEADPQYVALAKARLAPRSAALLTAVTRARSRQRKKAA